MADLILTAMVPPAWDTSYVALSGNAYRATQTDGFVMVPPVDQPSLTVAGFITVTGGNAATYLTAGDTPTQDVGWAVAE